MKSIQPLSHVYVRVPLLFLLVLSPIAMIASAGANPGDTFSACTNQKLDSEMLNAGSVVSSQSVQDFATSSLQYQTAVVGFNSSYTGFNDEFSINRVDCTVSWHDAAANFKIQNEKKGENYALVIEEDPRLGIVYGVTKDVYSEASIAQHGSTTYSGYAIANDSSTPHTTAVDYVTANWNVPDLSGPTGSGSPTCHWTAHNATTQCLFDEWTGLQNSTYDGANRTISSGTGEVIQTGTQGNYTCDTHLNCYVQAVGWNEYFRGNTAGEIEAPEYFCSAYISVSQGDGMSAQVGSEQQINGTSGSIYITVLIDETLDHSCKHNYATGTYVHTEYFADYFGERIQGTTGIYALPKFTESEFQDLGMGTGSSKQFGAYPNYNNGWGFGSYMANTTRNTSVTGMSETSGTTYGYFYEDWVSSVGTNDYHP